MQRQKDNFQLMITHFQNVRMGRRLLLPLCCVMGSLIAAGGSAGDQPVTATNATTITIADSNFRIEPPPCDSRDWSIQFGVAVISKSDIGQILTGGFNRADGDAGGLLYSLTVNWTAHRFKIPCFGRTLTPQFEPYLTLTLVDENSRSVFPDYNGGVGLRWVDFPWNKWIRTTFFMGIGLSYSSSIYTADLERHPGEDRSYLKFDWPIQFSLALPRWPQHQLVLFNDHQSGGHVFDQGGVNSFGMGYRFQF